MRVHFYTGIAVAALAADCATANYTEAETSLVSRSTAESWATPFELSQVDSLAELDADADAMVEANRRGARGGRGNKSGNRKDKGVMSKVGRMAGKAASSAMGKNKKSKRITKGNKGNKGAKGSKGKKARKGKKKTLNKSPKAA